MERSGKEPKGLSQAEAERRLKQAGPNQLVKPEKISFLGIAKEEVTEPMILLLLVVGVVYAAVGSPQDALTIFSIIFVLVFVEIWNEYRAKKAISALSELAAPKTRVMRDGTVVEVQTEKVVPGDVLVFTQGTRIAADCKLDLAYSIEVDESVLTGESLPQERKVGDEVFAGTLIVSGEGEGEAFATGENTEFGKISAQAQRIKPPKTPLQLAMKALSKTLAWVAIFFSVIIPLISFLRFGSQNPVQLILTGLALAFAAIPEELPIIITMILGLGSYTLSKKGFLVKKLKAAEVLGDATVIVTDKTGTITENKMRVANVFPRNEKARAVGSAAAALTEMSLSPTDRAVLEEANKLQVKMDFGSVIRERGFESSKRTKAVLRSRNGDYRLSIIGAPEEIIGQAGSNGFEEELRDEVGKGRRVIGVAERTVSAEEADSPFSDLEENWDFMGLISIEDPARQGVRETVDAIRRAGIRTIMVTGDHPQTAAYIANSVSIPSEKVLTGDDLNRLSDQELQKTVEEVSVFARTTPQDKYRLVNALHASNEVVAVTGDGVNDTLALKGADVGIAMGVKGTDAAKEAADVVLTDDNFVTIGQAVFEGRKLFDNLRKGLKYYLSIKAALISILFVPAALGLKPLPFAPIQIIVLELFMDLAASAGFVAEPSERTIYGRKPRNPKARFPDSKMILDLAASAASLFAAVMLAYFYARSLGLSDVEIQTFAFSAWIMGHIILAFVSRSETEPLYILGPLSNKVMDLWAVLAFAFLFIGIGVPSIGNQLKLSTLTLAQLGLILAFAVATIIWREVMKLPVFRKDQKL